ncbi:MAG: hypothetical protein WAQ27_06175, partial [Candidatus Microsaccharimonas sp.]
MGKRAKYTELELKEAVKSSPSWCQVCKKLGLKYAGGNVQLLKKKASVHQIPTDHFLGQGWNLNGVAKNKIPLEELLVVGREYNSAHLKRRLIQVGLKEDR